MRARSLRSTLLALPLVMAVLPSAPSATATGFRPPVVAPVSDPFRAPDGPYGPGNRGLDYSTIPGSAVVAIAAGVVVYVGAINHQLFVTVLHRNGLRSSYSFLAAVQVTLGQNVEAGQRLGTAGDDLQLGVRSGDRYIDPASLFQHRGRAHLVAPPG